jgi:hypothetical protein
VGASFNSASWKGNEGKEMKRKIHGGGWNMRIMDKDFAIPRNIVERTIRLIKRWKLCNGSVYEWRWVFVLSGCYCMCACQSLHWWLFFVGWGVKERGRGGVGASRARIREKEEHGDESDHGSEEFEGKVEAEWQEMKVFCHSMNFIAHIHLNRLASFSFLFQCEQVVVIWNGQKEFGIGPFAFLHQ